MRDAHAVEMLGVDERERRQGKMKNKIKTKASSIVTETAER